MPHHVYVPVIGDRVYDFLVPVNAPINLPTQHWKSPELVKPSTPVARVSLFGDASGLFVGSSTGAIYRLDPDNGTTLNKWSQGVGEVHTLAYRIGHLFFISDIPSTYPEESALNGWALMTNPISKWVHPGVKPVGLAVGSNRVFAIDNDEGKLLAFDYNGSPAWTSDLKDIVENVIPRSDGVYVRTLGGHVAKLALSSGDTIWNRELPMLVHWLAEGNGLIYAAGLGSDTRVFALRESDGQIIWQKPVSDPATVVLTRPEYSDGRLFVGTQGGTGNHFLHALAAADGTSLWTSQVPVAKDYDWISKPVAQCGLVFMTSPEGNLCAFIPANGHLAWKMPIPATNEDSLAWQAWPTVQCDTTTTGTGGNGSSGGFGLSPGPSPDPAIDPLALVLPPHVYAMLKLPYPPPIEHLAKALEPIAKKLSPETKQHVIARVKTIEGYAQVVEKVLGELEPAHAAR